MKFGCHEFSNWKILGDCRFTRQGSHNLEIFSVKTIQSKASIGHIRDLPQGAKELPKIQVGAWAYLGVNVDEDFAPVYIVPADKKKQVNKLKDLLKDVDQLFLATDEDREGEAISWHLFEVLKPKKCPSTAWCSTRSPKRPFTMRWLIHATSTRGLVRAQETRRILDGSRIRCFATALEKVGRGLSAGRVQSVAVRLIVERERERIAFHSATYFDLLARLATGYRDSSSMPEMVSYQGKRIPAGKDFDRPLAN